MFTPRMVRVNWMLRFVCVVGVATVHARRHINNPSQMQMDMHTLNMVARDATLGAVQYHSKLGSPKLGPALPFLWNGTGTQIQLFNGTKLLPFEPKNTQMMSNSFTNQSAYIMNIPIPFGPESFIQAGNSTLLLANLYQGDDFLIDTNGEVYYSNSSGAFYNIFAWTTASSYNGTKMVDGTLYAQWILQYPDPINGTEYTTTLELLLNADGSPFRNTLNTTIPLGAGPFGGESLNQITQFDTFFPNAALANNPFDGLNVSMYMDPPTCPNPPDAPKTVTTFMYIFAPANNFNISGQDLGDAQGDTFFTCVDLALHQSAAIDHDYAWITRWEVTYTNIIGQYQNCNGYHPPFCFGTNNFYVGHEAALALGRPIAGQCQLNPQVGEWYSLPVGGACGPTEEPDGTTCTWKARRVKTIDSHCLFTEKNFTNLCAADAMAPFPNATAAFVSAFGEYPTDPAACPPLGPTTAAV